MIRGIHHGLVVPLTISIVLLQLAFVPSSFAVEPDEILNDPALEQRARTLSAELRCLVCQNQSIDDSNAPLARDLRLLVRERLTAGESDKQVLDFIVARYGEFVLLRPPFGWHTLLLWLAPFLLLAGAIALARSVSSRNRHAMVAAKSRELTPDEQARLAKLMDANSDDPK
ncbi:MAG: cytochrome c-type biogenesis protein CcmH [Hyphomicrobiaceae bacterium TMED74]|nr:cytochrome C biogenesis protein CcmH [Filomicrobium sp.]RPG38395.1 MAG: cytochrome c-type biogenesis protein CcmH [Hyphomicrobiaceae bacterium TMED74]